MHHHLDKLAGVRLRADVDDEIASENRAISRIEEQIDNAGPIFLRTCAWCSAVAVEECSACEESVCEDCGVWRGVYIFCPECLGLAR